MAEVFDWNGGLKRHDARFCFSAYHNHIHLSEYKDAGAGIDMHRITATMRPQFCFADRHCLLGYHEWVNSSWHVSAKYIV